MPKEPDPAPPDIIAATCKAAIDQMDKGKIEADEKARVLFDFMKNVAEKSDTEVVLRFSDFSASHRCANKPWAANTFATSMSNVHKVLRNIKFDSPQIREEMMIAAIPPHKEYRDAKNPSFKVCWVSRKKSFRGIYVSLPVTKRKSSSSENPKVLEIENVLLKDSVHPENTNVIEDDTEQIQQEIKWFLDNNLVREQVVKEVVEIILNTKEPIEVYASIGVGETMIDVLHELTQRYNNFYRDHPIKKLLVRRLSDQTISRLSKPINLLPERFEEKLRTNLSKLKIYRCNENGKFRRPEILPYIRLPQYHGLIIGDYAFFGEWKVDCFGRIGPDILMNKITKDSHARLFNSFSYLIKSGDL